MFRNLIFIALIASGLAACGSAQETTPSTDNTSPPTNGLQARVDQALQDNELVALGVVITDSNGILDLAVSGSRHSESEEAVEADDAWHIGSNTKALTALAYGRLVERGQARWRATLPELFPDLADEIDPAWSEITIEDLLSHRSGVGNIDGRWLNDRRRDERSLVEQRLETTRQTLAQPPAGAPGTFAYSNLGYIIAGSAIEQILQDETGEPVSWEGAMQDLVFEAAPDPEARGGWGYGPPKAGLEGHRRTLLGAYKPAGTGPNADNPEALGPAGTLHVPLKAHARLAAGFLTMDPDFLPATLRDRLWTPYPDASSNYALGWGTFDTSELGRVYSHNGSNTMWFSSIIIAPDHDLAVIVNTNKGDLSFEGAARDIAMGEIQRVIEKRQSETGLK